jgi:hypothetical protein
MGHLRHNGTGDTFLHHLNALANELTRTPPPIRYADRRYKLRRLHNINRNDWHQFCEDAHWNCTSPRTLERRAVVAARAWVLLTGGDWHHAPALTAETGHVSRRDAHRYLRPPTLLQGPPGPAEQSLAERIHASYQLTGPVTWAPSPTTNPQPSAGQGPPGQAGLAAAKPHNT